MEFKPLYYKDQLKIINPFGSAGIVTLWSKPERISEEIKKFYPSLFSQSSPLTTITSLYGNGLPQMLVNLAYNPQINKIAIVGKDSKLVPSSRYFINFLEQGISKENIGGVIMNRINGTSFYIDPQISPKNYSNLKFKQFSTNNLEGLVEFITQESSININENDRIKINLSQPEFKDFPSDLTSHNIYAETILEAWKEVMYHIDRFGKNVSLKKGDRRALINLDVNIKNPVIDSDTDLQKFGFYPDKLKQYQEDILNSDLPKELTYTYGNRIRSHWGGDSLEKISKMFREDSTQRHGLVSVWDTKQDLLEGNSSPCLTDIYFVQNPSDGKLMLTASFRTHNATSAWANNIYGLRAIQEKVARESNMEPGQINIRSRWIGIDPADPKIISLLKLIKSNRNIRLNINDPKGYYDLSVDKEKNELVVQHYSPKGLVLEEFRGPNAESIKNQLRQVDGFSNTDHAMWFGMELARVQKDLESKINL
jgi:thymidylate synthase